MEFDFVKKIEEIINNNFHINLFFAIKEDDGVVLKLADLENGRTQDNLKLQFKKLVEKEFINNKDLKIENLSIADDTTNTLYYYDYSEFPEKLDYFYKFKYRMNWEKFSFDEDEINNIKAYIIVIGDFADNYFVLYQKFYPFFLMDRSKNCYIIKSKKTFKEIDKDILKISNNYNFIKMDDEIYIKDIKTLESAGFKKIIMKKADEGINYIKKLGIIDNNDAFSDYIKKDVSLARKMNKVYKVSEVIKKNISTKEIIEFTKNEESLKGKFRYNEDETKLVLKTDKSKKEFLDLLGDNFLVSKLTNQYYNSSVKEPINSDD